MEPAEAARLPLYAGSGGEHLRNAKSRFPQSVRSAGLHQRRGPDHHFPVRIGLDAAYRRRAEHPHHGDDPATAWQYGDGRRRRQRPARPLQYSGLNRPRSAVDQPAGLSDAAV